MNVAVGFMLLVFVLMLLWLIFLGLKYCVLYVLVKLKFGGKKNV